MYLFVCSFFGEYIKPRGFCISFYVASTLGVFSSRIGASIIYSEIFKLAESIPIISQCNTFHKQRFLGHYKVKYVFLTSEGEA